MDESPVKKKARLEESRNNIKRANSMDITTISPKRPQLEQTAESIENDRAAMKRKNFIEACDKVSQQSYFNYQKRFMLLSIPKCVNGVCYHREPKNMISPISPAIEESLKIGIKTNSWFEALDNYHICLTHNSSQYFTSTILKDIVEIILNAQDDPYSEYSLRSILDKCKMILSLSFHKHTTCVSKNIKKSYTEFLTDEMDSKQHSFTNREDFGFRKGIVKYCWNRLENELNCEELNEPLVNKSYFTPEEMRMSITGLFWQKEKFEIYETMPRTERIDRIMMVLESIIELLQLDLVIWQSRYTCNLGVHMMKSHRPLMATVIWPNNVLCTGSINEFCQQIMKIFIDFICLDYPKHHINTVTLWLNTLIETIYMCETGSNSDYPNCGSYSNYFANGFYRHIKGLPTKFILKVLKSIQPTYMRHLIGVLHLKTVLNIKEDNILKIINDVLKNSTWTLFPHDKNYINDDVVSVKLPKSLNDFFLTDFSQLSMKTEPTEQVYPKHVDEFVLEDINQTELINLLYTTFDAYLDAYRVFDVKNTIDKLNENMNVDEDLDESRAYMITEAFVKKYRSIYKLLQEMIVLMNSLNSENKLSDDFLVFNNIIK